MYMIDGQLKLRLTLDCKSNYYLLYSAASWASTTGGATTTTPIDTITCYSSSIYIIDQVDYTKHKE